MNRRAFTLIELLVVIAIIGLLTTIAVTSFSGTQMNARNARRKADLIQISKALELYYSDHNAYPSTGGAFFGGVGTGYYDLPYVDPGSWIPGLTSGGYMAVLPRDPGTGKANTNSPDGACFSRTNNGYLYISNGTDYAVLAYCTPEGPASASDPFNIPGHGYRAWRIVSQVNATTNGWY
jgi:prepilin-type N-terminal cleavage/methylation domain